MRPGKASQFAEVVDWATDDGQELPFAKVRCESR